jgi:hypothetical protein
MTFDLLPYLPPSFDFFAFVSLLVISLLLIFVGSRLAEGLAFVVVGLVAASIGFALGVPFGTPSSLVGFVAGFLLGGAAAVLLLPVGMGLALGFMGYQVAASLTGIELVPVMVAIVCFTYGLFLTDLLLPVVSSAAGGLMLYDAAISLGMPTPEMVLVVATMSMIGVVVQTVPFRRANGAIRRRPTLVRTRV